MHFYLIVNSMVLAVIYIISIQAVVAVCEAKCSPIRLGEGKYT